MRSGFTRLELLLATSVAAVFLALAQGPLLHFSSLLTDQYTTSAKQRQLDRFLLMLKAELIQAVDTRWEMMLNRCRCLQMK